VIKPLIVLGVAEQGKRDNADRLDGQRAGRGADDSAEPNLTRRGVIAAGAALGGGVLLGASSLAQAQTPLQARPRAPLPALARLRDEIHGSQVKAHLKSRLLAIIDKATAEIKHGQKLVATNTLQERLKPVLETNRSRHGLSAKQAREWISDTDQIVSRLNPRAGRLGLVYIFNLMPFALALTDLNGVGPLGRIPAVKEANQWAPEHVFTWRTYLNREQLSPGEVRFVNGTNSLDLDVGGQLLQRQVEVPKPPVLSLETDLSLYLCYSQVVLVNSANGDALPQP
jgi:hypothetical protein